MNRLLRRFTLSCLGVFALLLASWHGPAAAAWATSGPQTISNHANSSLPLDLYSDARAAYALHLLSTSYVGPALTVRRGSDNAQRDIGFTASGALDTAALESWLAGADGFVVRWHSQLAGEPDLEQSDAPRQPRIAMAGNVTKDSQGHIAIKFDADRNTYMDLASPLSEAYQVHNMMAVIIGELTSSETQHVVNFQRPRDWSHFTLSVRVSGNSFQVRGDLIESTLYNAFDRQPSAWMLNTNASTLHTFTNHFDTGSTPLTGETTRKEFRLGASTKKGDSGFDGFMAAFVLHSGQSTTDGVLERYDSYNELLSLGAVGYSPDAILPQRTEWQVDLYNWLKSLTVEDVRLPSMSMKWDGGPDRVDDLADIWLQLEGVSASRVVRGEPEWYVLDAGNGKGIEATGEVRIWHEPESGHGNPPRSWSNEPAFLYQLSIPNGDGSEGNPYHRLRPLGLRALVVAAVDMMMYSEVGKGYARWTDMYGKALLGWAEAYRWTKSEIPDEVQNAFEDGFSQFLGMVISNGARGVNTNMDMFAVQAAAEIYMSTEDDALREKAVQAVRRVFFGYVDGEISVRHDTWANSMKEPRGVFSPAGYIMEGGQPDIFYQGESLYHLVGALSALTDRQTGAIPSEWAFLGEVVERMETWFVYQAFRDPGRASSKGPFDTNFYHGGAGFAGRTGAPFPAGQAAFNWRDLTLADYFEVGRPRLFNASHGHVSSPKSVILPLPWQMENAVEDRLQSLTSAMSTTFTGEPNVWKGWSPWTKPTPYLPTKGWYSRLNQLIEQGDPSVKLPIDRDGYYYSKAFGGPPIGLEYWVHKDSDGIRDFGWFVEAQANQGSYGGWYGGKIETFWTSTTGVVLLNRHGKGGCGDRFEDSVCWQNVEYRAAHHVWGRDETGRAFTPLHITSEDPLVRSSDFRLDEESPSVKVVNVFNAEGREGEGEQNDTVLEGAVTITNFFEEVGGGLRMTHTVASDETDEVTELWASLPIFLRGHRPGDWGHQSGLEDTRIEYWDGSSWVAMPEDTNGDDIPEFVRTTALRLGRDFLLGAGMQYAYIAFEGAQRVRLASQVYSDPYQTRTIVRTVHIDLHGSPGTTLSLPAHKTLQYTIQTTEPALSNMGTIDQRLELEKGWNMISRYVQPADASFKVMLAEVQSSLVLVKDGQGAAYAPGLGIDNLAVWKAGEAYEVFAREDCSVKLTGIPMDVVPVNLKKGWNVIGYPFSGPRPVDEVIASIVDAVVVLEDSNGGRYVPSEGINTVGELMPGHGYRVNVSRDVSLIFSPPQ